MRQSYDHTPAGAAGRLDTAIEILGKQSGYEFIEPSPATDEQILLGHTKQLMNDVRGDSDSKSGLLHDVARLAAGGAIMTAEFAARGEPAFGLIRPPGHHSSKDSYWGYCYFSNMALSLLWLRSMGMIRSAFVLDFDLHVGDGTINILGPDKSFVIHNPSGHGDDAYLADVRRALDACPDVDIATASAGFDQYEHCWGKNLTSGAFRKIGLLMHDFALERCGGRRYGLLEGGYNHRDLGKNILSFCEGLLGKKA